MREKPWEEIIDVELMIEEHEVSIGKITEVFSGFSQVEITKAERIKK